MLQMVEWLAVASVDQNLVNQYTHSLATLQMYLITGRLYRSYFRILFSSKCDSGPVVGVYSITNDDITVVINSYILDLWSQLRR